MKRPVAMLSLFVVAALAGCVQDEAGPLDPDALTLQALADGKTTLAEREGLAWDVTNERSRTLLPGPFGVPDLGLDIYIDIPLAATEGGSALNPTDPPRAHLGLFMPEIPGCDWTASDLPEQCHVPVVADAGPYYRTPGDPLGSEGDNPATEPAGRLGGFLIQNLVPHGFAVAQISVMGSGLSNHCFDMFGLAEQLGVHHAVEWLGTQPWSNGNVGLIGRSYDGSTPWMAAKHGSPHLKTIVPISGLSGLGDLVQWNGASESRILTFHNVIYGTFGLDQNELLTDLATTAACPDWGTAIPMGAASYATGDDVIGAEPAYWAERHFIPGTLENYQGSLYMIHGLQDGNVDPHAGWIGELALREAGFDVKGLWGQWYHSYPDRVSEHGFDGRPESIRMDWAQDLLEWFTFYLKDEGPQPDLHMEIQQLDGAWRVEETWPPEDAVIVDLPIGSGNFVTSAAGGTGVYSLGVLSGDEDTLLGGFSTVTLEVTPTGPGGQIFVELRDLTLDQDLGLSYGIMDLRHATGSFAPVAPGVPMTVTVPFTLFDAVIPAGHQLGIALGHSGSGFLPNPIGAPVSIDLASSTVHLSTLERGDDAYFMPPIWWEEVGEEVVQIEAEVEG